MSYKQIQEQRTFNPNYVQPVSDYRLGWLAFADGESIEVCTTDDMARGWTRALYSASYADASAYLEAQS